MTNTKSTKRALLASVMAMLLCFSMLLGTTFAWFTDSVTSSGNKIVAGTLDVQLLMDTGMGYEDISDSTSPIFGKGSIAQNNNAQTLWEPGKTHVAYLAIKNNGNLALKYRVTLDVENVSKDLYEVMEYAIVPDAQYGSVTSWNGGNSVVVGPQSVSDYVGLNVGETHYFALAIHMNEEAGNSYQSGEVNFDLTVVATQLNSESDNFGSDYDEAAPLLVWDGSVDTSWYVAGEAEYILDTPAKLAGLAQLVNSGISFANVTIKLGADMDLNNLTWTPIGVDDANFNGSFNGNGYTIYNLKVTGTEGVGFIGIAGNAASIENITVDGAIVNGNHYVGTILGYGYLSANSLAGCFVNNATVVCTPDSDNDNGDKAGVIAGVAINGNIYNNKITNSTVYAYRDFGSIVGMAQAENRDIEVYDNTAENVELIYIACDDYKDSTKTNSNMGELIGRENNAGKTVTVADNNKSKNIVKNDEAVKVVTPDTISNVSENETVYVAPGVYTDIPSIGQGATLIGTDGVVFNDTLSGTLNNTTIKNVEISAGNAQRWGYSKGTLVFEDCIFEATSVYAIHYDGLNGANITYKNCKIVGWVAIASGAEHITFDGCEIYGNGTYGLIRLYSPGTIKNCVFDVSAVNTSDVYQDGIHAVDCTITVENCVNVNGAIEDIFNNSGFGVIKTVSENGTAVSNVATVAGLSAALENGGDVVLDGTVDLGGTNGNYLTLNQDTTITGGTIKGTGWTGELNYAVNATSGNIVFDGVTFDTTDWSTVGWAGWGISVNVNGTANVTFKNCTFKGTQCPIYQSGADSVITLENCKFETTSVAIQCEIYSGDFYLGQDLIVKNCDFTGVAEVLHIYDYDKDPSSEAIAQYLTDNGNTFTGVCKQTCN